MPEKGRVSRVRGIWRALACAVKMLRMKGEPGNPGLPGKWLLKWSVCVLLFSAHVYGYM